MQPRRATGRDGALDGLPGQLVAEDQAASGAGEQPGAVQAAQRGQVHAELPAAPGRRGGPARSRPAGAPRSPRAATSVVRARTASRTDSGSGRSGSLATSVTKNGLPPVTPCTVSAASVGSRRPALRPRRATAAPSWRVVRPSSRAMSPSSGRAGDALRPRRRGRSPRARRRIASTRRTRNRSTSTDAASTQCRSSTTAPWARTRGTRIPPRTAAVRRMSSSRTSGPRPTARAMSRNGPSGRGVLSGSQLPAEDPDARDLRGDRLEQRRLPGARVAGDPARRAAGRFCAPRMRPRRR